MKIPTNIIKIPKPNVITIEKGNRTILKKEISPNSVVHIKDNANNTTTFDAYSTCLPVLVQPDGSLVVFPGKLADYINKGPAQKSVEEYNRTLKIMYENAKQAKRVVELPSTVPATTHGK
jgi:hypothetical protein